MLLRDLACSSPFDLVTPSSFYPFCYQLSQQASLVSQPNALQDCGSRSAQLVWFQSIDELQQQLVPALFARGLVRGRQRHVLISRLDESVQIFGPVDSSIPPWIAGNGSYRITTLALISIRRSSINSVLMPCVSRKSSLNDAWQVSCHFSGSIDLLLVCPDILWTTSVHCLVSDVLHTVQNLRNTTALE